MPTIQAFNLDSSNPSQVIFLDRWSSPDCTITLDTLDASDVNVQGTHQKINRGETPVWHDLYGTRSDNPGSNEVYDGNWSTAPGLAIPVHGPFEALLITAQGGNEEATGHVAQAHRS